MVAAKPMREKYDPYLTQELLAKVVLAELLAGTPRNGSVHGVNASELLPRLRRGEVPDVDRVAPDAPAALRRALAAHIGVHATGVEVRAVAALPRLASGKVDYPALETSVSTGAIVPSGGANSSS